MEYVSDLKAGMAGIAVSYAPMLMYASARQVGAGRKPGRSFSMRSYSSIQSQVTALSVAAGLAVIVRSAIGSSSLRQEVKVMRTIARGKNL